jgi:hypothetical protein
MTDLSSCFKCGNPLPEVVKLTERGFLSENYTTYQVVCQLCGLRGKPSDREGCNPGDPPPTKLENIATPEELDDMLEKIFSKFPEYLVLSSTAEKTEPTEHSWTTNAKNEAIHNWNREVKPCSD